MNPSLGHWLFSTLGARKSRALRQPDGLPIQGTFHPDQGAVPDILTNAEAFRARYDLNVLNLKGSEIGEGRVPDRSELQQCVRGADNPCSLDNNTTYVVTEIDVLDLRYVALVGRPVWEFIEAQGLLCLGDHPPNGNGGECEKQLQEAKGQIIELRTEIAQKNTRIGLLEAEVARLAALVPVVVPADVDETVELLKSKSDGEVFTIRRGLMARFARLGRFVESLKTRRP